VRVVAHGLQASAMPYWHDLLSDRDMREVVAFIKGLSPVFDGPPPQPLVIPPRVTPDAASLARGRDLYVDACAEGHGPDGRA
jgi:mono/diheme cytochrome c family protein